MNFLFLKTNQNNRSSTFTSHEYLELLKYVILRIIYISYEPEQDFGFF